jgi:hypothetical protein
MHKKAALNTLKLFALAMTVALGTSLAFNYLSSVVLFSILGAGVMGYLIYIFYSIEKTRLERLESLNKTVD